MPKVSQCLARFLASQRAKHNGPDILERWSIDMETQVNVSAGNGERVDGKPSTYTDGVNEWFSFRIPKGANSEPTFSDYNLSFPLELHAEAIGTSGWDWRSRRSRWVGFDFDSIAGHAAGIGISDAELAAVKERASALPWVEVRRSTRGRGAHLYCYFDCAGVPTANHTDHAALGRAVLGMMSSETGFDFATQVDAAGGNMWFWSRHATEDNGGLGLEKAAERVLSVSDLPTNWRDHIDVVKRRRPKVRVDGVDAAHEESFEEMTSRRRRVPLDAGHKAVIDELARLGCATWVSDHHLLRTHTAALERLMEDHKQELGLKGIFRTVSRGTNMAEPNCFAFPMENGAWNVVRFSPGVVEASTWTQDEERWTCCTFNKTPDLRTAARALGGREDEERNGFVFASVADARRVGNSIGEPLDLMEGMQDRETLLKASKNGRLVVKIERCNRDDPAAMTKAGWVQKKNYWSQVFDAKAAQKSSDSSLADFDKSIRALIVPSGERAGWMTRHSAGDWNRVPKDDARSSLLADGLSKPEADVMLGRAVKEAWRLVNLPFQPEYPGDRQWNLNAPQYRFRPAELDDDQAPEHPHWSKILNHLGSDLDAAVSGSTHCREANVRSGADYLLAWIAIMLRHPFHQLPYLFFHGPENCGKSILHEAINLLITEGYVFADRALTNASDFNAELAGAILCVVEEKDISKAQGALAKLKEFVTSGTLSIRKMRTDSYQVPNMTHWIQCTNDRKYLPVFPGDTRVVVFEVPPLTEDIPKKELLAKLNTEAPHFMRAILDLPLPPEVGRLWLPVLHSESKRRSEEENRTPLEIFIAEETYQAPGHIISFADFCSAANVWFAAEGHPDMPKHHIARQWPSSIAKGRQNKSVVMVGNIALEPNPKVSDPTPFVVKDGKLRR